MRQILLVFLTVIINICCFAQKKIRITCVGNSITYGARMDDRVHNNYPTQLQNMLGDTYEVLNFGVSGTTLLKKGNAPYWKTPEYKAALASNPNIVFIKLGTNDSKMVNRPFYNEFVDDYKDLVTSFQQQPSHPRVVLLLPVPSFVTDSSAIYEPVITKNIIPMIQQVAYDKKLELINLHPLFINHPDLLPDKMHPSSLGATVIAKRLYENIMMYADKGFDIFSRIQEKKTYSSFYGFDCIDFKYAGRDCKVVKPRVAAGDHPWVWRARFWGHEPQCDISLLERGYHIVYCDVTELFGNSTAVSLWNSFYALMQQCGLHKKAVLEGMSRGGVYIYNWALANPGKVACAYADAPVLDLKSWPGGKFKGAGSRNDWEIFKKDYGFTEEQAMAFHHNPLDNAAKIARLGFPMLHVVGDLDDVVPIAENTTPFEQKVKAAGGNITVIHKPDVKHHPHSLQDPTPITNFILAATGYKVNFAAIPAAGAEYRTGAGWNEGKGWWVQKENIDSLLTAGPGLDILFLGNSITQGIGGHRSYVTHKPGLAVFDSVFDKYKWECAGISGDRTQNILYRLQHGNYVKANPKVLVLTIGVNNFNDDDSPREIASGILAIVRWVTTNMPHTKLVLTGMLPTGVNKDEPRREKYNSIQQLLAAQKNKTYIYAPLTGIFSLPGGNLDLNKYAADGIHLKPAGYSAWALALQPVIAKALSKKP